MLPFFEPKIVTLVPQIMQTYAKFEKFTFSILYNFSLPNIAILMISLCSFSLCVSSFLINRLKFSLAWKIVHRNEKEIMVCRKDVSEWCIPNPHLWSYSKTLFENREYMIKTERSQIYHIISPFLSYCNFKLKNEYHLMVPPHGQACFSACPEWI